MILTLFRTFYFNPLNFIQIMEENEKMKILSERQFGVIVIGDTFIVREGSQAGPVVHVCGSYKDLCEFFSSL